MANPNTPIKIQVAFTAMAYCQSVESECRPLSNHERGMLLAGQNLVRDWLNGEIELQSPVEMNGHPGFSVPPFMMAMAEDEESSGSDDEDESSSEAID